MNVSTHKVHSASAIYSESDVCNGMRWNELNWTGNRDTLACACVRSRACVCVWVDHTDSQNIPIGACIHTFIAYVYFVIVLALLYRAILSVLLHQMQWKLFPLCTVHTWVYAQTHANDVNSTPQQPIHSVHVCERWECFTHTYVPIRTHTHSQSHSNKHIHF